MWAFRAAVPEGKRARAATSMVLLLDELRWQDVLSYRCAIEGLPLRELVCGFVSGVEELAAWDASEGAQLIDVPLLMMMGSRADTGYMTIDCFERAVNAPVRELFEIPGATHIQTYWKPEYVSQAAGKLVEFFGKHV